MQREVACWAKNLNGWGCNWHFPTQKSNSKFVLNFNQLIILDESMIILHRGRGPAGPQPVRPVCTPPLGQLGLAIQGGKQKLASPGGSLPLVLYNHMRTKGIFMGAIYFLIWISGKLLKQEKKSKLHQIRNTLYVI